jgi:hypothetical protein
MQPSGITGEAGFRMSRIAAAPLRLYRGKHTEGLYDTALALAFSGSNTSVSSQCFQIAKTLFVGGIDLFDIDVFAVTQNGLTHCFPFGD